MNNQNIIYALIGASTVALAWIATAAVSAITVNAAFAAYVIAAVLLLIWQDYRNSAKALK
ncbi:hypothetical protein [Actomonas aquatica]|uniref:Uncharacterized protein n=1 Tax=Actomonas aquatica TaxID=2866162 RepID=A0ABZ1CHZ5_9BACT|nr:hypothetical protein [Opitutus sp. WL0086]WRQ89880.1 hypothetical protein K1X11_010725 [Opitutus sp. WL0086]